MLPLLSIISDSQGSGSILLPFVHLVQNLETKQTGGKCSMTVLAEKAEAWSLRAVNFRMFAQI